ncbi:hypothetical protein N7450_003103 [Penicillium hetheringtonii]|uniref:Uncharacterized protein n=1 Tax=Penicillium hetheringtonii TaxID=911720 RepID=A0AAD6DXR9_9EURO|nr:hypothetical protein N7450_003103 [Penicillium hetheringtonii]
MTDQQLQQYTGLGNSVIDHPGADTSNTFSVSTENVDLVILFFNNTYAWHLIQPTVLQDITGEAMAVTGAIGISGISCSSTPEQRIESILWHWLVSTSETDLAGRNVQSTEMNNRRRRADTELQDAPPPAYDPQRLPAYTNPTASTLANDRHDKHELQQNGPHQDEEDLPRRESS